MSKKYFIAFVILVGLLSILTGCSKKVKCDFCGDEKICETKTFLGEEVHICRDCQEIMGTVFE